MDAALLALLTDVVQVQTWTGMDGYGSPTYAAAIQVPARVEWRVRRIVNAQGQERMSRARVFLDAGITVGLQDKITLPDGTAPAIQLIGTPTDETGAIHHCEVTF